VLYSGGDGLPQGVGGTAPRLVGVVAQSCGVRALMLGRVSRSGGVMCAGTLERGGLRLRGRSTLERGGPRPRGRSALERGGPRLRGRSALPLWRAAGATRAVIVSCVRFGFVD
jgi:hypothetical protein